MAANDKTNDKVKQSLYFPDEMLADIACEANRLDRSLSWMVQRAWALARERIRRFPAPEAGRPAGPQEGTSPAPRSQEQVREFLRGKFDHDATLGP